MDAPHIKAYKKKILFCRIMAAVYIIGGCTSLYLAGKENHFGYIVLAAICMFAGNMYMDLIVSTRIKLEQDRNNPNYRRTHIYVGK